MYSGYVNITSAPDYYFYWFFGTQDKNENAPLIIWTNGTAKLVKIVFVSAIFIVASFPFSSQAALVALPWKALPQNTAL